MNDTRKTAAYGGVALLLVLLAWATAPRVRVPDVFMDRGELFFPQFTDPNIATSLEVIEFDERNGAARPLKVLNRSGHWTIPSHFNYPADARDHLAQTAAAVIALRKDDFAGDNAADHERCGVLDPLDAALPSLKGRGTRVVIRGENERLLADIIIGQPPAGRQELRYVRLPGQKRVYLSRVGDLQLSTDFGDWIERDLLQVDPKEIDEISVRNYSLDEATGGVNVRESLLLQRRGQEEWRVSDAASDEELNSVPMNLLVTKLVGMKILGVLPKPPGITAVLSASRTGARVSPADVADLARKGFYLTPDGQLLSNEGEMIVHSERGIFYTLRFGQLAPGTSDAVPPATKSAESGDKPAPSGENRYLFIMAAFDPSSARSPARPTEDGEKRAALLRARFAPWYYIISADDFSKIRVRRADLVRKKQPARPRASA